jgi:hypothetical protein
VCFRRSSTRNSPSARTRYSSATCRKKARRNGLPVSRARSAYSAAAWWYRLALVSGLLVSEKTLSMRRSHEGGSDCLVFNSDGGRTFQRQNAARCRKPPADSNWNRRARRARRSARPQAASSGRPYSGSAVTCPARPHIASPGRSGTRCCHWARFVHSRYLESHERNLLSKAELDMASRQRRRRENKAAHVAGTSWGNTMRMGVLVSGILLMR